VGVLAGGAGAAMTRQLELFLQGGLGNQLIQLAYADSLQVRTGSRVRINPVMLHPIWSRLRSISLRNRSWPWASPLPEVIDVPRQVWGVLRLYQSRFRAGPITDCLDDAELLQRITSNPANRWVGLLGYFQRRQAFDESSQRFWSHLKNNLLQRYSLIPFPHGQVVAHIRLGDYLWPANQRLFARYPLGQQIHDACSWSNQLGGPKSIHLVTDDPLNLKRLLTQLQLPSLEFTIHQADNAEDDFLFLARHRHIVGSNSTFSLCAGRLASELWGKAQVLRIPSKWYEDDAKNYQILADLDQCPFVYRMDQCGLD